MDEFSWLYKEVSDLTTLISLSFKRPPNLGECGDAPSASAGDIVPDSPSFEEPKTGDDEGTELVDEADFEDEVATGDSEAALAALKRRALDRLAEVLARFKTAKNTRARGKFTNLDAKHVTSVAMMEDSNHERVAIFCSKNEGIDADDKMFLAELGKLLKSIAGNGT